MDHLPNIHQRMLNVMRDVTYVQKADQKVNGQYRFVTHDAVTAKVREAFVKHGIVSIVSVEAHAQDGNRTTVDVSVDFVNSDAPTDRVTIKAFGYGIDPQDKGPGKAISYAVKYAYLKAFALETGDDPERDSIDHKPDTAVERITNGKGTARQHAVDTFESMSPEEQDYIRSHVDEIHRIYTVNGPNGDLCSYIESQRFDNEEKLALWSLLPSNIRSAIKKQQQATQLASQP